jgi:hypothetical protein
MSPLKTAFSESTSPLEMISLAIVAGVWLAIFGVFIVHTVYHEHLDATGRWQAVVKEKNNLKAGLLTRDQYIGSLQSGQQQSDREAIQKLEDDNKKLTADIAERMQFLHPEDPAFSRFEALTRNFETFKRIIPDKMRCEIAITAPPHSGSSSSIISQLAIALRLSSQCATPDFGNQDDPDVADKVTKGMEAGVVIVHMEQANATTDWAPWFYRELGQYVPVKRSFEGMPKPQPSFPKDIPHAPMLWLQFGENVHWK